MLTIVNTPMDRLDPLLKTDVYVASTGSLTQADAPAILLAWGDCKVAVAGSAMGTYGLFAVQTRTPGGLMDIDVLSSGLFYGSTAGMLLAFGSYDIDNAGLIQGHVAITTDISSVDGTFQLRNTGVIKGDEVALDLKDNASHFLNATIANYGTIFATNLALNGQDTDSIYTVTNYGAIFGGILTSGGADKITNRGTIEGGSVQTGEGADQVFNQRAKADLVMDLGGGDDQAYLGRFAEEVTGGLGKDLVSYQHAGVVVLNLLDPTANQGAAEGDSFDGVEVFRGSDRGGDVMIGDASATTFEGMSGNDSLSGGGGADQLEGGFGSDLLTGGLGRDWFIFRGDFFGADMISDFNRAKGANQDKIAVLGASFGLDAGALALARFQSRADNVAQDANDKFIFRTTDHTLWSDQDGSGTAAPVLLCTLTNGVNLIAGDLLII